jgi:putative sigma-54 modulation protein
MNILVKAPHMPVTDAIRQRVEGKVAKLPRFYDSVQNVEVVLDKEAKMFVVEIIVTARRRNTFVAKSRDDDMYSCLDDCLDKISQQLRRHKDKVRDRQGPSHGQVLS